MKKVIIPVPSEDTISLIEIPKEFNGLIICKIQDNITGFIIWNDSDEVWLYVKYINLYRNYSDGNELIDLIQSLIKKYPNMEFFTTEVYNEK